MNRTPTDSLSQIVRRNTPRPPQLKATIHRVHYASRRVTVGARGYGVIPRVPVAVGINLGTPDAQIAVSGNTARLERQPDNTWLCISIITKNRCATGTISNVVELDTAPDNSIGFTTNNFASTIIPDTLFYPPFEVLGQLTIPALRPPIPGLFCPGTPPQQAGQVLCFDPVNNCLYWCDPVTPPPAGGTGDRVYLATDVGVVYTDTFLDVSPSWHTVNSGLGLADAKNVSRFIFDPFSAGGVLVTALQRAYIFTVDGIYKNMSLPTGGWTQALSPAALVALIGANSSPINQFVDARRGFSEVVCPINHQDYIGFLANRRVVTGTGYKAYWVYSLDAGATWNVSSFVWDEWYTGFAFASNKVADTIYVSARAIDAGTDGVLLFTSTDGGATFTQTVRWHTTTESAAPYLCFPYANNAGVAYGDDSHCYRTFDDDGGTHALESTSTFPTPVYINQWTDTTLDLTPYVAAYSGLMDINTFNEDYQYVLLRGSGAISSGAGFVYTHTGANGTWVFTAPQATGENPIWQTLSALPANTLFCTVANAAGTGDGRVYLTLDGGVTFDTREGDLNTVLSSIASIATVMPDFIFS